MYFSLVVSSLASFLGGRQFPYRLSNSPLLLSTCFSTVSLHLSNINTLLGERGDDSRLLPLHPLRWWIVTLLPLSRKFLSS